MIAGWADCVRSPSSQPPTPTQSGFLLPSPIPRHRKPYHAYRNVLRRGGMLMVVDHGDHMVFMESKPSKRAVNHFITQSTRANNINQFYAIVIVG